MPGAEMLDRALEAPHHRASSFGQVERDGARHEPYTTANHGESVSCKQDPLGPIEEAHMAGRVAGSADGLEISFDRIAIADQAVRGHGPRHGLAEQPLEEDR